MLHNHNSDSSVLICTPDYPPKLGGLSTFTLNIESVLKDLGIKYDLFVWKNQSEIKSLSEKQGLPYKEMIHIHGLSYQILSRTKKYSNDRVKHFNFFHGSEILFKGRNLLFTLFKKLMRPMALKQFEMAYANISISEFTQKQLVSQGYSIRYDRDYILHNGIQLDRDSSFVPKSLEEDTWFFICMARDVPHKNAEGVKELLKICSQITHKKIILYSGFDLEENSLFEHRSIKNIDNDELKKIYQKCHFNLLLSLDHSSQGFYEGFGLTVLEAGQYGTPSIVSPFGGLPEACHDKKTGWVLKLDTQSMRDFFVQLNEKDYQAICARVYQHTKISHSLDIYHRLFSHLLEQGSKESILSSSRNLL